MWVLISQQNEAEIHQFIVGKKYSVGRLDSDITIPTDKSISRKHAFLTVSHPEANVSSPHKPSILTVEDASKFGTLLKKEQIKGQRRVVQNGDIIKFGTMHSDYRAVHKVLIATTSCLDNAAKKHGKALICELGGHVVSEWRKDCSMLLMTTLSVTIKVICALISQCPIVTLEYLQKQIEAVKAKAKLPDTDDYLPPLAESQLNPAEVSFKENINRKSLFDGKVFIFLSTKQFKKLNVAVELAGGLPMLMEEGTDNNKDDILVEPHTIVMSCDPTDTSQNLSRNAQTWIRHVNDLLKKNRKRPIPDSELGYAVLYCSTEKYCNPNIDTASSQAMHRLPSQSLSQQPVFEEDTQTDRLNNNRQKKTGRKVSGPSTIAESELSRLDVEDVKVKSEIASQEMTPARSKGRGRGKKTTPAANSKISSFFGKKRQRDEDEDEETQTTKSARTETDRFAFQSQPSVPQIKAEPVTPRRTARRGGGDAEAGTSTDTAHQGAGPNTPAPDTSRSRSPPSPGSRPSRTRRSPSPASPAAARHSQRNRRNNTAVSDEENDFVRIVPRNKPKEVKHEIDDLFDEFDREVETRKSRSKKTAHVDRSPSPKSSTSEVKTEIVVEETELEDDSLQRRKTTKRGRESSSSPSPKPKPKRQRQPEVDAEINGETDKPQVKAAMSPVHRSQKPDSRINALKEDTPVVRKHRPSGPASKGFLNKNDCTKVVESDVPTDESLPCGVIQQEFVSLLVRRPKLQTKTDNQDSTRWKGRVVKNFKKFRKADHAGADQMPRIIGGTDLKPHASTANKDMEEWFKEAQEQDSQRAKEEAATNDLFDWEPSKRTAKSKRKK